MQALPLCAQQPVAREVTNVKMIGIGPSNILDTYLSPEHYNGFELRFIDQAERHKITTSSTPSTMGLCYSPESSNWTTTLTQRPSPIRPKSPTASPAQKMPTTSTAFTALSSPANVIGT